MSAETPPVRVDARNTRPGAPGSRPGLLAPPVGQAAAGRMGSRRKPRCRARGAPRSRPQAGAGRGVTGDSRGPHLHVEQLGRLIHPDGDGALTQGFAEHFLEGIPHLIHPTREREQGGPVSPSLFGSIAAPSPGTATLPPAFVRRRAARLSANPKPPPPARDPSHAQRPGGLRKAPPPSPEGAASPRRWAQPQAASRRSRTGRDGPFCPLPRPGGARPGGGGARSFRPPEPLRRSPKETGGRWLCKLLTARSPANLAQPGRAGCAQWARRAPGEAPAALPFGLLLSSREFFQSHIATAGPPQRESGVRAAPATVGARAPALYAPSQAPPAPAAAAPSVRPSRPTRSPAPTPSQFHRQLPHSH